ncbi:hypothetical protein E0H38_24295 [Rhizobium leguminosarum bv. viciae]|nr:hypothetical protein [Rhizobium laguerreae]TBZ10975.1 hypothetical protein E0H38_24295 [Rhizobium leguminosarum bv. viciae]TBZ18195.1 hypothetical protein E0H33_07600 [Rhizobium leguminosarum bv. viciae]
MLPDKASHPGRTGVGIDNRSFVIGCLWILRSGAPSQSLPGALWQVEGGPPPVQSLAPCRSMGAGL